MSMNSYYPYPLDKFTAKKSKLKSRDAHMTANIDWSMFKAKLKNKPELWVL